MALFCNSCGVAFHSKGVVVQCGICNNDLVCSDCQDLRAEIKRKDECCEQALEFVSSIMNHVRDNDEHTIHFVKMTQAWLEKAMKNDS